VIRAGIIGTGIGLKHFEAINNYRGSKVLCIFEKNKKKATLLKKKLNM
jgi:predicted dehydrogenase